MVENYVMSDHTHPVFKAPSLEGYSYRDHAGRRKL